jgi:hypothetical protein
VLAPVQDRGEIKVIWIFATVVLLLVVLHPGFRRVMAWLTGGAVVVAAVVFAVMWWRSAHPTVDISDLPVPPAAGAPVPCYDLPENLRAGANCTVPRCPAGVDTTPGVCFAPTDMGPAPPANPLDSLPPPFDTSTAKPCEKPPAKPTPGCVSQSSEPWKEYAVPAGHTLDCPVGQTHAQDNRTGMQSCYDPHDRVQLAEHLKECNIRPGDPYAGTGRVIADRRNIPCNPFDRFDGAKP